MRYDEDKRENTTETPHGLPARSVRIQGEVRHAHFERDAAQGHAALQAQRRHHLLRRLEPRLPQRRFQPDGRRRGRRRQRHRGCERPVRGRGRRHLGSGLQGRVPRPAPQRRACALFSTKSTNGYFFVFLAANSTQNLGNLDADYEGAEFEISAKVTGQPRAVRQLTAITDSEITGMEDPSVIGNQAPLVSETRATSVRSIVTPLGSDLHLAIARRLPRTPAQTWWEPYNVTSRDPDRPGRSAHRAWRPRNGRSPPGRRTSPTRNTTPSSRRADSCSVALPIRIRPRIHLFTSDVE